MDNNWIVVKKEKTQANRKCFLPFINEEYLETLRMADYEARFRVVRVKVSRYAKTG